MKLSHLHFGPVGGGKRQNLIRQPRPHAFFVEIEQRENAFADEVLRRLQSRSEFERRALRDGEAGNEVRSRWWCVAVDPCAAQAGAVRHRR